MDLDALESGRAELSATYKSLTVNFHYYPERVGMNLQRALAAVTRPPHDMGPIADELANIVAGWDVKRGGVSVALTPEGVGSLPMGVSSAVGRAIMEDFNDPKSPTTADIPSGWSTASPATSEPEVNSASAPGLPSPSSTPAGPASHPGISPDSPTPPPPADA